MKKIWFNDDLLAEILEENGIELICNENMEIVISDEDAERAVVLLEEKAPFSNGDYGIEDSEGWYSVGSSMDEWDQTFAEGMTYNKALDFFEQLTGDAKDERYQELVGHCTGGCFWIADDSGEYIKEFRVEPLEN